MRSLSSKQHHQPWWLVAGPLSRPRYWDNKEAFDYSLSSPLSRRSWEATLSSSTTASSIFRSRPSKTASQTPPPSFLPLFPISCPSFGNRGITILATPIALSHPCVPFSLDSSRNRNPNRQSLRHGAMGGGFQLSPESSNDRAPFLSSIPSSRCHGQWLPIVVGIVQSPNPFPFFLFNSSPFLFFIDSSVISP